MFPIRNGTLHLLKVVFSLSTQMSNTSVDWGLRRSYVGWLEAHFIKSLCRRQVILGELWECGICGYLSGAVHNRAIAQVPGMIK